MPRLKVPAILSCIILSVSSTFARNADTDSICILSQSKDTIILDKDHATFSHSKDTSKFILPPQEDADRNWWHLLKKKELNLNDTTVEYPRFLKFCIKVYNWADRTFNSYDPEYVEGTGKKWKARIVSDNWTDSYNISFGKGASMTMKSQPIANLGAYLQFMAVSVGYSFNMNHLITGAPISHNKMAFSFNCARFNVDFEYVENSGGSYLRNLSTYDKKKNFKSFFPGVNLHSITVDAYYFLNNRRYSQGAAYNFSKFQKKSSGSFIFGFTYSNEDISIDFSTLDAEIIPYFRQMNLPQYFYKFHYNNYCLLFGYGYNIVFNKHFLMNFTILPSIGFNHCYEDSADGSIHQFSLNPNGKFSLTYNTGNFFTGLQWSAHCSWYKSSTKSLFNPILNLNASAGLRF